MDFKEQDRHYRRGMILGLTLAEVMLLVLFCLLLILLYTIRQQAEQKPSEKQKALIEHLNELGYVAHQNDFDDLFQTLTLLVQVGGVEAIKGLTDVVRDVVVVPGSPAAAVASSAGRGSQRDPTLAVAKPASRLGQDRQPDRTEAKRAVTPANQARRLVEAKLKALAQVAHTDQTALDTKEIVDATAALAELLKARDVLQGRSAHQMIVEALRGERQRAEVPAEAASKTNPDKKKPGGSGTEHPACWVSDDTGKPEYLFDVALGSQTIRIHDNALPQRAADQQSLPLSLMAYDEPLSSARFMAITLPLLEWSKQHDCRFFVRVLDQTEAQEKAIYKNSLRIVGERFYHFEDVKGPLAR